MTGWKHYFKIYYSQLIDQCGSRGFDVICICIDDLMCGEYAGSSGGYWSCLNPNLNLNLDGFTFS